MGSLSLASATSAISVEATSSAVILRVAAINLVEAVVLAATARVSP